MPSPDFVSQAWWKLVMNAALGGVCALAVRDNSLVQQPEVQELILAAMREVIAVGRAEGAELPDDAPEKAIALVMRGAPGHWSSIALDRREGRPMEWRARNAVVGQSVARVASMQYCSKRRALAKDEACCWPWVMSTTHTIPPPRS